MATSPDCFVVGIGGPSCSGKTSISLALKEEFRHVILVHQDDFYKDIKDCPQTPDMGIYWDVPESLNTSHLKQHLEKILKSPLQFCPICIDSTSSWHGDHLIVVEGTMILTLKCLEGIFALKVFLNTSYEECSLRRSKKEFDVPEIPGYFDKYTWPACESVKKEVETWIKNGDNRILLVSEMPALKETTTAVLEEIRTRRNSLKNPVEL